MCLLFVLGSAYSSITDITEHFVLLLCLCPNDLKPKHTHIEHSSNKCLTLQCNVPCFLLLSWDFETSFLGQSSSPDVSWTQYIPTSPPPQWLKAGEGRREGVRHPLPIKPNTQIPGFQMITFFVHVSPSLLQSYRAAQGTRRLDVTLAAVAEESIIYLDSTHTETRRIS